jgi:hypothetical protein
MGLVKNALDNPGIFKRLSEEESREIFERVYKEVMAIPPEELAKIPRDPLFGDLADFLTKARREKQP